MTDRTTGAPIMTLATMRNPSIGAQVTVLTTVRVHKREVHLAITTGTVNHPKDLSPCAMAVVRKDTTLQNAQMRRTGAQHAKDCIILLMNAQ
jgi:hypothetical protein